MIKKLFNLDSIDLRIISLFQDNSEVSHVEIGRIVNRTQPSVRTRIIKLREKGFKRIFGVDFKKINIILAQVFIQTSDTYHINQIIDEPNGNMGKMLVWTSTGKYNLNMLVCGKSITKIENTVNTLLRNEKSVKSIKLEIINNLLTEFVLPLNYNLENKK